MKVIEFSFLMKIIILSIIIKWEFDVNNKILYINEFLKFVCVIKGWIFIDNLCIEIVYFKNKGIYLNKDGVKFFVVNIIR